MKAHWKATLRRPIEREYLATLNAAERNSYGVHSGRTVRLVACSPRPRDHESGQEVFTASLAFVTDTELVLDLKRDTE